MFDFDCWNCNKKVTKLEIAVFPRVKTTIEAAESKTKPPLLRILVVMNLAATAAVPDAMTMVVVKIPLLSLFIRKRNFH